MTTYLIQLLVFQALFLGVYELFLKRETFFSLNRIYLLATPFLAAIIPLLEFEILQNVVPMEGIVQLPTLIISENTASEGVSTALDLTGEVGLFGVLPSAVEGWLLIFYALGAIISFTVFLRKYLQLQGLKYSGKTEKTGKISLVRIPESRMACTFFTTIFLGENLSEAETSQILKHEMAHVEQKHSWDLLLFEFLRIVLWFSPFVYRYQAQLSTLHEYIADEKVTQNSEKNAYFQELLNATFGTQQISFTNQFFTQSLIKKRIMMLQKPKSNRNAKLKYLLVLPLLFMMLTYVACSEDKTVNETQEMLPSPPPPPAPPTEAYQDYLELIKYMKTKDASFDWTFEEYQIFVSFANRTRIPSEIIRMTDVDMDGISEVPFSAVEQVPVFPGCENLSDNEAQKTCMSKKIQELVNDNFDTGLAKKLGLSGTNRIQVMFKINQNGEVVEVKARAPHPELQQEAVRVVEMLPEMIPGKQNGKAVSVLYSLPIIFQVN